MSGGKVSHYQLLYLPVFLIAKNFIQSHVVYCSNVCGLRLLSIAYFQLRRVLYV